MAERKRTSAFKMDGGVERFTYLRNYSQAVHEIFNGNQDALRKIYEVEPGLFKTPDASGKLELKTNPEPSVGQVKSAIYKARGKFNLESSAEDYSKVAEFAYQVSGGKMAPTLEECDKLRAQYLADQRARAKNAEAEYKQSQDDLANAKKDVKKGRGKRNRWLVGGILTTLLSLGLAGGLGYGIWTAVTTALASNFGIAFGLSVGGIGLALLTAVPIVKGIGKLISTIVRKVKEANAQIKVAKEKYKEKEAVYKEKNAAMEASNQMKAEDDEYIKGLGKEEADRINRQVSAIERGEDLGKEDERSAAEKFDDLPFSRAFGGPGRENAEEKAEEKEEEIEPIDENELEDAFDNEEERERLADLVRAPLTEEEKREGNRNLYERATDPRSNPESEDARRDRERAANKILENAREEARKDYYEAFAPSRTPESEDARRDRERAAEKIMRNAEAENLRDTVLSPLTDEEKQHYYNGLVDPEKNPDTPEAKKDRERAAGKILRNAEFELSDEERKKYQDLMRQPISDKERADFYDNIVKPEKVRANDQLTAENEEQDLGNADAGETPANPQSSRHYIGAGIIRGGKEPRRTEGPNRTPSRNTNDVAFEDDEFEDDEFEDDEFEDEVEDEAPVRKPAPTKKEATPKTKKPEKKEKEPRVKRPSKETKEKVKKEKKWLTMGGIASLLIKEGAQKGASAIKRGAGKLRDKIAKAYQNGKQKRAAKKAAKQAAKEAAVENVAPEETPKSVEPKQEEKPKYPNIPDVEKLDKMYNDALHSYTNRGVVVERDENGAIVADNRGAITRYIYSQFPHNEDGRYDARNEDIMRYLDDKFAQSQAEAREQKRVDAALESQADELEALDNTDSGFVVGEAETQTRGKKQKEPKEKKGFFSRFKRPSKKTKEKVEKQEKWLTMGGVLGVMVKDGVSAVKSGAAKLRGKISTSYQSFKKNLAEKKAKRKAAKQERETQVENNEEPAPVELTDKQKEDWQRQWDRALEEENHGLARFSKTLRKKRAAVDIMTGKHGRRPDSDAYKQAKAFARSQGVKFPDDPKPKRKLFGKARKASKETQEEVSKRIPGLTIGSIVGAYFKDRVSTVKEKIGKFADRKHERAEIEAESKAGDQPRAITAVVWDREFGKFVDGLNTSGKLENETLTPEQWQQFKEVYLGKMKYLYGKSFKEPAQAEFNGQLLGVVVDKQVGENVVDYINNEEVQKQVVEQMVSCGVDKAAAEDLVKKQVTRLKNSAIFEVEQPAKEEPEDNTPTPRERKKDSNEALYQNAIQEVIAQDVNFDSALAGYFGVQDESTLSDEEKEALARQKDEVRQIWADELATVYNSSDLDGAAWSSRKKLMDKMKSLGTIDNQRLKKLRLTLLDRSQQLAAQKRQQRDQKLAEPEADEMDR